MRALSVKTTLILYLVTFLVTLWGVFGLSYEIRHQSYKALEEGFTVNLRLVVLLSQINEELRHTDSVVEEYLFTGDEFYVEEFRKLSLSLQNKIDHALKLSKQPSLSDLTKEVQDFLARRGDLIQSNQAKGLSEDTIRNIIKDDSIADQIFKQILSVEESNIASLEKRRLDVDRSAKTALYVKLFGSLVASLVFSFFLARYLVWPVSSLAKATSLWRLGDKWNATSPVSSHEFVSLYHEMSELSRRLNNHYAELLRSNRDLEEFASIASHDLRSPLANIGGMVKILTEKLSDRVTKEERGCLDMIYSNVQRMEFLVKNLLAYARIGATSLNLTTSSLNAVVDQAVKLLASEILKHRAIITRDELPTLSIDREQILQLFQNLFENSVKYRRSEPLKIHISAKQQDDYWIVSVEDNGIGIPRHDLHRVFEIFRRSINVSGTRGVGLGLSIVKRIVERHGGSIWLESELGKGTTVYFSLKSKESLDSRSLLAQADKDRSESFS